VTDASKDGEMVPSLLELKASLDGVQRDAFGGNESFSHALKDAFETFINARANRPAELVAKYIDGALRAVRALVSSASSRIIFLIFSFLAPPAFPSQGNKGTSEEELETLLERVLILFRYISGKDVFEAFYKKDLAKRLLLGKSASIDAEKSMIAKLKAECGAAFTTKLEGMFKDVETSRDVAAAFRASPAARRVPAGTEVAVSVLTAGCAHARTPRTPRGARLIRALIHTHALESALNLAIPGVSLLQLLADVPRCGSDASG
jgi:cullin-4